MTTTTTSRGRLRPISLGAARRALALTVVGIATAALTACAGSSDGGAAADTSFGPTAASAADGVAEAKKIVEQYSAPPTWQGPDATVDVSGLQGKKVVYISVSNGIPVLKYWSETVKQLVKSVAGIDLTIVDAKGSVDEANKGFQQAIAEKADAVVLVAFSTSLFAGQISQAKAAGIKVITAQSGVPGKVDGGQAAEVSFDYVKVGQLIGDWVVADSDGKAKALIVTSDDVPASQPQAQATKSEIERLCPDCDVKIQDVQIAQWETSIPTLFRTTIASDPTRTYILPLYDGQALPGLGAIRTAGAGDKVSVGAFNATPGIVEQLKDPASGLKLDVGGQNEWWAYACSDTIMRVLAGSDPIENYNVGLRIFDTQNADLISGSDEFTWYGDAADYKAEFTKLWTK
ncbi:sugar ABC transporter substrate-binding protein [Jatrophihabitans sp. YIM 134969]